MPEHSMRKKIEEATSADLVAFYSHLKNLIKAGVPIQPGIQEIDIRRLTSQDREAHSPNDSNSLAPSDASSFDVWPLIHTNPKFPRNFRLAFAAWIASDKHPDAFQILNYAKQTSVLKSLSWVWRTSLRLVFLFAMITLLLWQATGGTALKNLYKDSSFPPGPIGSINIQINNYLSDWMATTSPILKILVAITFAGSALWWLCRRKPIKSSTNHLLTANSANAFTDDLFLEFLDSRPPANGNATHSLSSSIALLAFLDTTSPENESASPTSPPKQTSSAADSTRIYQVYAKIWGRKRLAEHATNQKVHLRPFLIYLSVGALITLTVAASILIPIFEYITDLSYNEAM